MNTKRCALLVGAVVMVTAGSAIAQGRIRCESRSYQYQFCATPEGVTRAQLVEQRSRSQCVEGRTWGYDRRGIWVSGGCDGVFDYQGVRPQPAPAPGAGVISCESRNYQYEFCGVGDRVLSAAMVRQKSRTPCVLGRTWGWRENGVWVSEGCEADFQVQTAHRPSPVPPGANVLVCESQEYRYNFCPTGRIRNARLVEQRSQAPCIRDQTWGVQREGIWVDNGCEAAFRVDTR